MNMMITGLTPAFSGHKGKGAHGGPSGCKRKHRNGDKPDSGRVLDSSGKVIANDVQAFLRSKGVTEQEQPRRRRH